MAAVRALLTRISRLERSEVPAVSPFERTYGSVEAFTALVHAGIEAGELDHRDAPCVLAAIQRWHDDQVWNVWQ